jgi:hypothetical protein
MYLKPQIHDTQDTSTIHVGYIGIYSRIRISSPTCGRLDARWGNALGASLAEAVLVAQVGVLLLLEGVHGLDLVHGLAGGDDDRVEFIEQLIIIMVLLVLLSALEYRIVSSCARISVAGCQLINDEFLLQGCSRASS